MRKASKEKSAGLIPDPGAKLFDPLREVMRFHHYSYRTEKTYGQWIRRYLAFHRRRDRSGADRGWRRGRIANGGWHWFHRQAKRRRRSALPAQSKRCREENQHEEYEAHEENLRTLALGAWLFVAFVRFVVPNDPSWTPGWQAALRLISDG